MTSEEIRKSFLDFFAARGHKVMAGTSLIPADPTTLFTSAGVQQFVPAFRGDVPPPARRLATCQKCLRADDIEKVGDAWHETFFEMLGNFSIGDYFKKEAIEWAWEYSVKELALPKERIWISVHPQDEEAHSAWRNLGVPESRIVKLEENWWPLSATWVGSTGPCTELYLDIGEERGCGRPDCAPGCSCDRFNEYWNLVFPQFFQEADGSRRPLENPGVDTGLGLERLAAIMQGKDNIFETDVFQPIVEAIHKQAEEINPAYGQRTSDDGQRMRAVRIIADHARAVAFALAEGVMPSNEGRGYVVRKLLRRARYFAWKLGGSSLGPEGTRSLSEHAFLGSVVKSVCETMGEAYPELRDREHFILENVSAEERRFENAVVIGLSDLQQHIRFAKRSELSGRDVFYWYDTFGIPVDLTREIAAEHGLGIDEEEFQRELEVQRARSRAGVGEKFAAQRSGVYQGFIGTTEFVGYEKTEEEALVIGIIKEGESKKSVGLAEVEVILDRTPFYAGAGGQVGDTGRLESQGASCAVLDTVSPVEGVVAHRVRVERGFLRLGDRVRAIVDTQRRRAVARAHTATHLLHFALRQTLGEHALQAGSLVDADYLRFDFSHFEKLTKEQLERISAEVNRLILENHLVKARKTDLETARKEGATALFGEKYGEQVRLLQIGEFSRELCGGTHLRSTAEVGPFLLVNEESVGAGLRRIEALCGQRATERIQENARLLTAAAVALNASEGELVSKIEGLLSELKQAQRKIASLQEVQTEKIAEESLTKVERVGEVSVLTCQVPPMPRKMLGALADALLKRLGSGVVVLAAEGEDTWPMVAKISSDLVKKGLHAGRILGEVAKIAGGGGGGRADFAQAGAKDPSRLAEALARVRILVAKHNEG